MGLYDLKQPVLVRRDTYPAFHEQAKLLVSFFIKNQPPLLHWEGLGGGILSADGHLTEMSGEGCSKTMIMSLKTLVVT